MRGALYIYMLTLLRFTNKMNTPAFVSKILRLTHSDVWDSYICRGTVIVQKYTSTSKILNIWKLSSSCFVKSFVLSDNNKIISKSNKIPWHFSNRLLSYFYNIRNFVDFLESNCLSLNIGCSSCIQLFICDLIVIFSVINNWIFLN